MPLDKGPADEGAMLVELRDVSFGHGAEPLFRDFSLEIAAGAHSLVIGNSGSGKSTLINLICGFLTPDAGTIRIAGEAMSDAGEAGRDAIRRRHIGAVFQSLRLISALDITANLLLAARLAGRPAGKDEIAHLLDRLAIRDKARALPRQLSQGEAQRAAIARALIAHPRLLVADEPTSALDDGNAGAVADLLWEVAEEQRATLLIATHDARLKARFANAIHLPAGAARQAA